MLPQDLCQKKVKNVICITNPQKSQYLNVNTQKALKMKILLAFEQNGILCITPNYEKARLLKKMDNFEVFYQTERGNTPRAVSPSYLDSAAHTLI